MESKTIFQCELFICMEDGEEFYWKDFNDKTITLRKTGENIYQNDTRYNQYLLKAANRCMQGDMKIFGKLLKEIYDIRITTDYEKYTKQTVLFADDNGKPTWREVYVKPLEPPYDETLINPNRAWD